MKINWKKALGYGAIIYAIAFLVATAFVAFKINPRDLIPWIVVMLIVIVAGYYFAKKLDLINYKTAYAYGVIWLVEVLVLDYLFTMPFTGTSFFIDWKTFVNYIVIVLIPVSVIYFKKK